jgi:uncharacterized phage protein gp47/JayE
MPFVPRTKDQIRDSILANLQSRFQASNDGVSVDVRPGSRYYMLADAIALEHAGIEAQAQAQTKQILPDKADSENLARHANVQGVPREAAVASVLSIRVTGTPSTVVAIGSASLASTGGLTFAPNAPTVTTDGSGNGTLAVTCQTPGAAGNLATNTVLQWSAAPVGLNPTGRVLSITTAGAEIETEAAWALRIIARMQERPASFNRADVVAIAEAYSSVSEAYVYPLLEPGTDTVDTPGTLQIVVLGPIAEDANGIRNGDSPTNTRFIGTPGAERTEIEAYFEGTVDDEGVAVPAASQKQLRPVTLPVGNYSIHSASKLPQHIELTAVVTAANAKQWSGTLAGVAGTNDDTHFTVSGDHTALSGLRMLVELPTASYRGARKMVTPTSAMLNGSGDTVFTVPSLGGTPVFPSTVYPAPANWNAIRLAIFALFDRLTPGDASSSSRRWPGDDEAGPSTLYLGELIAAICSVPGVINATVVAPVADVVPALKTIVDLTIITLTTN